MPLEEERARLSALELLPPLVSLHRDEQTGELMVTLRQLVSNRSTGVMTQNADGVQLKSGQFRHLLHHLKVVEQCFAASEQPHVALHDGALRMFASPPALLSHHQPRPQSTVVQPPTPPPRSAGNTNKKRKVGKQHQQANLEGIVTEKTSSTASQPSFLNNASAAEQPPMLFAPSYASNCLPAESISHQC